MPRGRPLAILDLTAEEERFLQGLANKPTAELRVARRARVILLCAEGRANNAVAERVGLTEDTVGKIRARFLAKRLTALHDAPRLGRPLVHDHATRLAILTLATQTPEANSHWSLRDIAEKTKIPKSTVHLILAEAALQPHRQEMWLNSKDPDFAAKEADVIGLYLNPPENAIVFCVDEKTSIQCNTPTHPDKPMLPTSPAKREFEYERHGVVNLFAAFNVHQGDVIAQTKERKRCVEFLEFMDHLVLVAPRGKEIHVIVDNLITHKTQDVEAWLKKHPRVHFHFTPTHASWLNQVELWFGILERKLLKRGFFNSKKDLAKKMMRFIRYYNRSAKPFAWTYKGKPLTVR